MLHVGSGKTIKKSFRIFRTLEDKIWRYLDKFLQFRDVYGIFGSCLLAM